MEQSPEPRPASYTPLIRRYMEQRRAAESGEPNLLSLLGLESSDASVKPTPDSQRVLATLADRGRDIAPRPEATPARRLVRRRAPSAAPQPAGDRLPPYTTLRVR